jgi:hypothetical protein
MRRSMGGPLALMMLALAGCSTPAPEPAPVPRMPVVRLSPASLGCTLTAQQRITIEVPGSSPQAADVLLEVEPGSLSLALLALGQTVARLGWDGRQLQEVRAPWAPKQLSGERILSELQLAGWPLAELQRALPEGWRLDATPDGRELRHGDELVLRIATQSARSWRLDNLRQSYALTIQTLSSSVEDANPDASRRGPACS